MYGKIFKQMFDSTINETPLHVRFVWIALLVICDEEGVVDATPQAIARRINVPVDQVQDAISQLSEPDPLSRTPDEDGRRIVPIRPTYGWRIVNYEHYRRLRSQEDRREYMRDLMRVKRSKRQNNDDDPKLEGSFESVWQRYPNRIGRKEALRHFKASVKTDDDFVAINHALDNYLRKIELERIEPKFIKNGSTWFNNWRDYIDAGKVIPIGGPKGYGNAK